MSPQVSYLEIRIHVFAVVYHCRVSHWLAKLLSRFRNSTELLIFGAKLDAGVHKRVGVNGGLVSRACVEHLFLVDTLRNCFALVQILFNLKITF